MCEKKWSETKEKWKKSRKNWKMKEMSRIEMGFVCMTYGEQNGIVRVKHARFPKLFQQGVGRCQQRLVILLDSRVLVVELDTDLKKFIHKIKFRVEKSEKSRKKIRKIQEKNQKNPEKNQKNPGKNQEKNQEKNQKCPEKIRSESDSGVSRFLTNRTHKSYYKRLTLLSCPHVCLMS